MYVMSSFLCLKFDLKNLLENKRQNVQHQRHWNRESGGVTEINIGEIELTHNQVRCNEPYNLLFLIQRSLNKSNINLIPNVCMTTFKQSFNIATLYLLYLATLQCQIHQLAPCAANDFVCLQT